MRVSIYLVTKRGIDLFGAVSLIIILSPILLVLSILVKLTSKGPVIHWSKRIGRDNEVFLMAKFRTMKIETPQIATHLMSDPDSYLTSIGGYFRRKSLDELPQLVNILKGEISFVGPRPALFNQEDLIEARTKVKYIAFALESLVGHRFMDEMRYRFRRKWNMITTIWKIDLCSWIFVFC